MLAWSEGTDNGRQKTRNHGYDVIVGGELFTDYSDHPRLCHAKPKTQINRRGRLPASFPCWWDAYRKQLGLKDFSPKSQDAVALQQIKERGVLPCDWSWWYPSGNRPLQQYLGFTAGRWLWSSGAWRLTAWLQNSKKRAERSERLMYEQSHRRMPRSGYLHHRLPAAAVNHYRDNAITYKAQRDKNAREPKRMNAAPLLTVDASAWCCCARCKIHEGVSWC